MHAKAHRRAEQSNKIVVHYMPYLGKVRRVFVSECEERIKEKNRTRDSWEGNPVFAR